MIPIKDTVPCRTYPFTILLIISGNLLLFAFELSLSERIRNDFIYLFGLVPARYSHHGWAHFIGVHLDAYWPFVMNPFRTTDGCTSSATCGSSTSSATTWRTDWGIAGSCSCSFTFWPVWRRN
jgi:hypothetical protein